MVSLPIGGFMPIPLAMMIPFMATQSIVMGDAFGKAYQFGKRKISAMTNDEFNKTSISDLIANMQAEFKQSIPSIKQSITDSTELQQFIINELLAILPNIIKDQSQGLGENVATVAGEGAEIAQIFANSINKLFQSSPFNIPEAGATTGDITTGHQTFTQAEQDIQDAGKQSDIPLTLSSLSYSQIQSLYSDMLSNRGPSVNYTNKQKQQLTLAFKAGKDRTKIPETFTAIKDPTPQVSLDYHSVKTQLLAGINEHRRALAKLELNRKSNYYSSTGTYNPAFLSLITKLQKAVATAEKLLINHITKYRNITTTKAQANNDWNKRIWKL